MISSGRISGLEPMLGLEPAYLLRQVSSKAILANYPSPSHDRDAVLLHMTAFVAIDVENFCIAHVLLIAQFSSLNLTWKFLYRGYKRTL